MKKIFFSFLLVLLVFAAYVAAGPYITVSAIKSGFAENDTAKLERYIDFPLLRQNIKAQLNAAMAEDAARSTEKNFFAALMAGLKAKLVDGMVDAMVTPKGLANLMEGKKAVKSATATDSPPEEKKDIFKNARYTYDSLEHFSIWVPNEKGEETRFVLQRQGLSWKLVNFILNPQKS